MTLKDFLRSLMERKHIGYSEMARRLDLTEQAVWDRINSKKTNNLTIDRLNDMLGVLEYDVVLRDRASGEEFILGQQIDMPKGVPQKQKPPAEKKYRIPYFETMERLQAYIRMVRNEYQSQPTLYLNYGREADAKGVQTPKGFVLLKGSRIHPSPVESCPQYILEERERRKDLIDADSILMEDLVFNSASAAAGFVSGASISGRQWWRDESGCPLGLLPEIENKP